MTNGTAGHKAAQMWRLEDDGLKKRAVKESATAPFLGVMALALLFVGLLELYFLSPSGWISIPDSQFPLIPLALTLTIGLAVVLTYTLGYLLRLGLMFQYILPSMIICFPAAFMFHSWPDDLTTVGGLTAVAAVSIVPALIGCFSVLTSGARTEVIFADDAFSYSFDCLLGRTTKQARRADVELLIIEDRIQVIKQKNGTLHEHYGQLKLALRFGEELPLVDAVSLDTARIEGRRLAAFFDIPFVERQYNADNRMVMSTPPTSAKQQKAL